MKITGNEPIHPTFDTDINSVSWGITLRQYYAGLAMQGMLSHDNNTPGLIAEYSVKYADALIAALNATDETK